MKDQIYDPQLVHLDLLRNGYRVADLFSARGWRNVAVYGAGKDGKFFCDALKDTDVNIRCVIDMNKRAENPAPGRAPLIRPEEIGEYEQDLNVIIGCLGLYQNKLPEAESAFERRIVGRGRQKHPPSPAGHNPP